LLGRRFGKSPDRFFFTGTAPPEATPTLLREETQMKMDTQFTKLEKSRVKLDVTVPQAEVAEAYKGTLDKYAKSAQIPGFRKGKVPVNLLEQKFGDALKGDVAGDISRRPRRGVRVRERIPAPPPLFHPAMDKAPTSTSRRTSRSPSPTTSSPR
jgi:hypothetical protein